MNRWGQRCLLLGGAASFLITALHLAIILIGPWGYRFFGAPQLAPLAEQGSPIPALLTLGIAMVFALWGVYALSGAGLVRRLPLLRTGLIVIGAIYALRGLFLPFEVVMLVSGALTAPQEVVFSAGSLLIGLLHLVGTAVGWRSLTPKH